ncbi:TetR family transcriptional regulator [Lentzea sp. NBRC 105346]|uniref:TetR/AcrR family transcriptional regulator n=1 Tax=Lentzea sp. NBRC 105346 TaxID=3032205 RepID=UPI00255360D0|nr:TetR/AcrR family transcriptional regulator [Lentzea sp. NBRC 105346]GLZ30388.1 TetR family transcriptional regulator [Lentzea sp. NBRC 105346]
MRRNSERRAALLDAAIEVLAREGARGLTYRAVDTEAGVPAGTSSNYFPNRDELLHQIAVKIHERLMPSDASLAESLALPRDKALVERFMHDIVARADADRSSYLALLELRLEATRRPELRAALTRTISDNIEFNVAFHTEAGLPGDRTTVELLYLAMSSLIVERLTLPGVLSTVDQDALIKAMVERF